MSILILEGAYCPPLPRGSRYTRYTRYSRYSPHVLSGSNLCFWRIAKPSVREVFMAIATCHNLTNPALERPNAERHQQPGKIVFRDRPPPVPFAPRVIFDFCQTEADISTGDKILAGGVEQFANI